MPNKQHLKMLGQGVAKWNRWRNKNPDIYPDLSSADLHAAELNDFDLSFADLHGTNLSYAVLRGAKLNSARLENADLRRANLNGADLRLVYLNRADLQMAEVCGAALIRAGLNHANLSGADLSRADLSHADLSMTNLSHANLSDATLRSANLRRAILAGTNLGGACLGGADLRFTAFVHADLTGASFNQATTLETVFAGVDLRSAEALETLRHWGPSELSISTVYFSEGRIPEVFLRSCGVPDEYIAQIPSLVAAMQPRQFNSCFISYSSTDEELAQRLYEDLQGRGVRCWFAPEHLKIGEKIRVGIDESIRLHDKLLLILSKNSIESEWVEKEVETAMERERQQKRTILFPIRLDDTVMSVESGWAADVRRARNIGDFRRWKSHDTYSKAFERLLRDLQASA